jgi:hypothetical protein
MSDLRKPPVNAAPSERGRDLQKVNDRLKELVASLKVENERLAPDSRAHRPALTPVPSAPPVPDAADHEHRRLAAELALAREEVAHANAERERLREQLTEIEAENQRLCDEYVAAQERSTDFAQLYVALERIHGSHSRAETLTAVQEIVINLVGSEELAIFERRGDALALAHSFGVNLGRLGSPRLGEGAIGRAAATGRLYVAGRDGPSDAGDGDLSAAVPLRVGGEVAGVIAIFRLLGHKPGLGEADQAVFDLLSSHAGLALRLRSPREVAAAG